MNQMKGAEKAQSILDLLDAIEAEMKSIGFWMATPPQIEAGSYLDAPSFELWLQCIFLPNARAAAKAGQYPNTSQVGVMAAREYDYHTQVEAASKLTHLLRMFDQLVISR